MPPHATTSFLPPSLPPSKKRRHGKVLVPSILPLSSTLHIRRSFSCSDGHFLGTKTPARYITLSPSFSSPRHSSSKMIISLLVCNFNEDTIHLTSGASEYYIISILNSTSPSSYNNIVFFFSEFYTADKKDDLCSSAWLQQC